MVVTPHPDELQGFSRDGQNSTHVAHLPGDNHTDLLFLVKLTTDEGVMHLSFSQNETQVFS